MSIMLRHRPVAEPWAELSRGVQVKQAAVPAWAGSLARAAYGKIQGAIAGATPAVQAFGRKVDKHVGPALWPAKTMADTSKQLGWVGGAATVGGATGYVGNRMLNDNQRAGLGNLVLGFQPNAAARAADRAGAAAEAQSHAIEAAQQQAAGPKPLAGIGEAFAPVRKGIVDNWPLLAAGGLALGGGGMWLKNRADRRRKEEEDELLAGLHPKEAMVKLASEFPVQVGFLARCGERKLSGREVREAIEKCAAISDGIADDWIRFFDAAAGHEAGGPSGLIKAAVDPVPGLPQVPGLPKVEAPKVATPPLVQAPTPEPDPNPIAHELAGVTWGGKPPMVPKSQLDAAGIGTATGPARPPGYRPAAPQPAAPGPALTNQQRAMAQAAPDDVIAQRREYARKLQLAEKSNDQAGAAALRAQGVPQGSPAGPAGADRPALDPVALGRRNQLARQGQRDADDAEEGIAGEQAAFWNSMGRNQWIPERQDVQDAQAQKARMVNRGMDPAMAEGADWTRPDNDPTVGSYAGRFARRVPSAIAALPTTALNAVHDTSRGVGGMLRGRGTDGFDYTNTQDAARDFAAPFTEGLGGATTQGPQIHDTVYQDTMPGAADKLHDYAGGTEGNMLSRGLASMAETPTRYAGDIIGTAMLGGLGAAGGTGLPAAITSRVAALGPHVNTALSYLGLSPGAVATGSGVGAALGQGTGSTQANYKQEQMDKALAGDPAAYQKARPMPANPDDAGGWAQGFYETQREGRNAQRAKDGYGPMNEQEELAFKEQTMAPVVAKVEQMHQQRIARQVPGMADAQGNFNPNGQIDISPATGYNPADTRTYMTPERTAAMSHMHNADVGTLDKAVQGLPPEMASRVSSGQPLTPEDMAALQKNGIDPATIKAAAGRLAYSTPLLKSVGEHNGDMAATAKATQTPEAMLGAAQKDEALAMRAKATAAANGTDFMTGLKQTWDGLGTMGQILVGGGLAVGLFGLINSVMGEGGMGSMLMTLLGGGAAMLGANKGGLLPQGMSDMINPVLKSLGLDSLAGGKPGAANPAGVPTVTAPGTKPAAPAAGDVNFADPTSRAAFLAKGPAAHDALMATKLNDPDFQTSIARASWYWDNHPDRVVEGAQEKMPGVTMPEMKAMIDSYRRTTGKPY